MKTLGISAAIAGVLVGQLWNGHGTETLGAYMIVLAAVLGVAACLLELDARRRDAEREVQR